MSDILPGEEEARRQDELEYEGKLEPINETEEPIETEEEAEPEGEDKAELERIKKLEADYIAKEAEWKRREKALQENLNQRDIELEQERSANLKLNQELKVRKAPPEEPPPPISHPTRRRVPKPRKLSLFPKR